MTIKAMQRFQKLRVAVGIPSQGHWVTDFAISVMNMITYFHTHRVGEYKSQMLQVVSTKGSILPKMRRETVKAALEMDADYLLWLDSDHTFPRNIIHRMVHHNKDVLAANCATKQLPSSPTARRRPVGDEPLGGMPIYTDADSPELEEVWRIGTGIMMVNMKVYKKTGPNIFHMHFREDVDAYQGEDWAMCEAFEAAGFKMWIDHPLSDQCGHIGLYNFGHEHVGSLQKIEAIKERLIVEPAVADVAAKDMPRIKLIGEA